jgi:hypothetical protein
METRVDVGQNNMQTASLWFGQNTRMPSIDLQLNQATAALI